MCSHHAIVRLGMGNKPKVGNLKKVATAAGA